MKRLSVLFGLVFLSVAGAAHAADRWVHVRVEGSRHLDEQVRLDLPLSLVGAFLRGNDHDWGDWHLGSHSAFSDVDLREVLAALRDAPDGEFIRIRDHDDSVRVAKDAGFFVADVDERDGDRVRIRLPLSVLDALLDDGNDRLDLPAALEAVADYEGDLVTVDSDDQRVRIWIDARSGSD